MLDVSIFFLVQNIFLVTLLFWLLSFLGTKFFKKKTYRATHELFECGFLTTHSLNLSFNYNFLITATLLILYDVEFFFFITRTVQLLSYLFRNNKHFFVFYHFYRHFVCLRLGDGYTRLKCLGLVVVAQW